MSRGKTKEPLIEVPLSTLSELVVTAYYKDIERTSSYFIYKHNMDRDLTDELIQEASLLLMTSLSRYDHSRSALRTYVINLTNIAGKRFRSKVFKDYGETAHWEVDLELEGYDHEESIEEILDRLDMEDFEKEVVLDRVNGYTFKEITERTGESSRQIYNIIDKTKKNYKDSIDL